MKIRMRPAFAVLLWLLSACAMTRGPEGPDPTARALAVLEKANSSLKRVVLENGTICLIKEDRSAPVVAVQVWVGTGAIHEQEYLGAGLSHAMEHMIFKGTPKRKVGDITREINDVGGKINAYTSSDRTVFLVDLPSKSWRVGLDVLGDAVMNCSFPEEEWKKERDVILREHAMGKDDPNRVLYKLHARTAYTVHPYKFPTIGHEDVFQTLTREDLLEFFRRNYTPDNMMMVVVGDIDPEEVEKEIRTLFKDFKRRRRSPVVVPKEPPQTSPRFARGTGAYRVSRLEWSYHTVHLNHPDTPALDVLAAIVGHGRSSRLVQEIKEKQRLVHSIDAWSYTPREPGMFGISATFAPEKEKEALAAIEKEVLSWSSTDFSRDEIEKARRMTLTSELSELQTMRGQARGYATGELYANDARFSETYLRQLAGVIPQELREVARKYLLPRRRTLTILSPATAAEKKSTKSRATQIPKVEKVSLRNGVPLIVRTDSRLPFVYFCVALKGGLLSENEGNTGITRLMSNLLTRGTRTRTSEEIARHVESLGGQLYTFSGYNSFGLRAKCLADDAETFMATLADCLLNASFPPTEIDKQSQIQAAAIDQQHERPFFLAAKALRGLVFPGHPYRWDALGTKKTVAGITRTDLQEHLRKSVATANVVVAVFGDINRDRAVALAEKHLNAIPAAAERASARPAVAEGLLHGSREPRPTLPARTKQRVPKRQAIFLAGFPGVAVNDPRRDALAIVDSALSGLSSDLSMQIREKRGLVYYVGSYQQIGIDPGMFVLYAGTREEAVSEVEKLIREEMNRLTGKGIRQEELERARRRIIAEHEMSLQNNSGLAMSCALDELLGLGYQHSFTTAERFEALTLKDVTDAARSVLSTNKMAISVVLPVEQKDEKK